jgi:beta-mannosidase
MGESSLEVTRRSTGTGVAEITITSRGYSFMTRVLAPAPGVVFDTNYFDLRDGESRVVRVTGLPEGVSAEDLVVRSFVG